MSGLTLYLAFWLPGMFLILGACLYLLVLLDAKREGVTRQQDGSTKRLDAS
jgi:hypothetical protein